jgi:hypothetical protein
MSLVSCGCSLEWLDGDQGNDHQFQIRIFLGWVNQKMAMREKVPVIPTAIVVMDH